MFEIISSIFSFQCYKTLKQLQEFWKIHKHIVTNQHALEQPMDQRPKEKKIKEYLESNENENLIQLSIYIKKKIKYIPLNLHL